MHSQIHKQIFKCTGILGAQTDCETGGEPMSAMKITGVFVLLALAVLCLASE